MITNEQVVRGVTPPGTEEALQLFEDTAWANIPLTIYHSKVQYAVEVLLSFDWHLCAL